MLLGKPARLAGLNAEEDAAIKSLMLLTMKPVIYAANVADGDLSTGNGMSTQVFDYAAKEGCRAVLVSGVTMIECDNDDDDDDDAADDDDDDEDDDEDGEYDDDDD